MRREEGKAAKAEQKRIAKQEKRKSKEASAAQKSVHTEPKVVSAEAETASPTVVVAEDETANPTEAHETPVVEQPVVEKPIIKNPTRDVDTTPAPKGYIAPAGLRTSMEMETEGRLNEITQEGEKSPTSSDSPKGVKSWLRTKFRRQSKTQKSESKDMGADKGVVGAAALTEAGNASIETNTSSAKYPEPRKSSIEEVTLAGPSTTSEEPVETVYEERTGRSKRRASSVSSMSALEESREMGKEVSRDDDFEECRDHFDNELAPPPTFATTKSASPVRDSRFHEEM
jgi:hypothetical protein